MHILVATAGALPAGRVADLVAGIAQGPTSRVSVLSVIEVPRSFLSDLEDEAWRPFDGEESVESITYQEQAARRYIEERGGRLVEPVIAALRARDLEARAIFREGDDPAEVIVDVAHREHADMIIMGATRPLFDESVWSSVSVKVMQQTPVPLLLVPGVLRSLDDVERDERKRAIDQQSL